MIKIKDSDLTLDQDNNVINHFLIQLKKRPNLPQPVKLEFIPVLGDHAIKAYFQEPYTRGVSEKVYELIWKSMDKFNIQIDYAFVWGFEQ